MYMELLIFIASLATIFFIWQNHSQSYWKRNGIKFIKPIPIVGNLRAFLTGKVPFYEQISLFHNAEGFEKEPLIGVYMLRGPAVVVRDLELIKTIMIKKFNYFANRAVNTDTHHDPLGCNNLFLVRSPEWKGIRSKMSPVFTSGKLKQMYPLMIEIAKDLELNLSKIPINSVILIKDICARFTTDLIATTAFGVKANSLTNIKSEFLEHSMAAFNLDGLRLLDGFIIFLLPALASIARVKFFSKRSSEFFSRTISYVLAEREKSGTYRNDLVDVLLAIKREAIEKGDEKAQELDFLVAQAAAFQTAGFETSSSTMALTLYELALNTELQDRLREEVKEYFGNEDHISYERIQEMPYLSQVVNETLRKYPLAGYAERECVQPEAGEKFTLKPYNDFEVPNGMPFYISTLAIHRDEQYWPDPEKYDPERFAPENRHNINMDAYMPFGIGPRNCIGMRLGLLQAKVGLVHLLREHRVIKCYKTIKSIKFSIKSPVMASDVDIYLQLLRAN